MLNKIIAALLAKFTAQNVEQALSQFNKIVDRLQGIAEANLRKAAVHAMTVKEAQAAQLLAEAEAERAKVAAGKIKTLVSGS